MMEGIKLFLEENPNYGYLIAVAGFSFYLLGLILDWDWAVERGGYNNSTYWIEKLSRKTVRVFLGIVMILGIMGCLTAFFLTESLEH